MSAASDVTPTQGERATLVRAGVRIEYFTVAWPESLPFDHLQ